MLSTPNSANQGINGGDSPRQVSFQPRAGGSTYTAKVTVQYTDLNSGFQYSTSGVVGGAITQPPSDVTQNVIVPPTQSLPDLVISSASWEPSMTINTPYQLLVTTKNSGAADAGASQTELATSNSNDFSAIPPLPPSKSFDSTFTVTCTQVGAFQFHIIADAQNNVAESDEINDDNLATADCVDNGATGTVDNSGNSNPGNYAAP